MIEKIISFIKRDWLLLIGITIIILTVISGVIFICSLNRVRKTREEIVDTVTPIFISTVERAYMEGQKDVIEGDIRIEKEGDDWKWIKSPWDDSERKPSYKYLSEYEGEHDAP
jgi:hypothetical protein